MDKNEGQTVTNEIVPILLFLLLDQIWNNLVQFHESTVGDVKEGGKGRIWFGWLRVLRKSWTKYGSEIQHTLILSAKLKGVNFILPTSLVDEKYLKNALNKMFSFERTKKIYNHALANF